MDLATQTHLLIDSITAWLVTQPSLIHKKRRQLYAVVLQRQQLADSLARYLIALGLPRRAQALDLARALGTGAPRPRRAPGGREGGQAL